MSATNKKQNHAKSAVLLAHLQQQLQRKETLKQFYQKTLAETENYKDKIENMEYEMANSENIHKLSPQKQMSQSSMMLTKSKVLGGCLEESSIKKNKSKIMSKSLIVKPETVTFEAEYQNCAESLNKLILNIVDKEHPSNKSKLSQKAGTNSSFYNKSMQKSIMGTAKKDALRINTQKSEVPQSKHGKITDDFGDLSMLADQDDIVNNLISNIKRQEQKYISLVLSNTELTVKQRMSNYLNRQCEKYNEVLFKLKQQQQEKTLSSLKTNKQIVKIGYTERMKEVVDRGLRSR